MSTAPDWDEPPELLEAQAAEVPPPRTRATRPRSVERVPPHNLDAERALLGALLLSRDAVAAAAAEVVPGADVFYRPSHAHIYKAITNLTARGEVADVITVADELRRSDLLDAAGGTAALVELQADAPGTTAAPHYARIVRDHALLRRLIGAAGSISERAYGVPDDVASLAAEAVTLLDAVRASSEFKSASRMHSGGGFVLDAPSEPPAIWGQGQDVLWAQGEPLLVVGPAGVGKSTLGGQLVRGRLGLSSDLLGFPLRAGRRRVLYLAMDRPAQIRRSLARQFHDDERPLLEDRLRVWTGPPTEDLARHPATLLAMAQAEEADTVVVDSLKDAAIGLSDDEVGSGLNRALQECVAAGVEVLGLHHQRKGQGGDKPKTLADVYGSTWITAGAGSVVLLWGAAGDPLVELIHLKQPADTVGPLRVEHHASHGTVSVFHSFDPLTFLRSRGQDGTTATDAAKAMFEKANPTDNERKKVQRQLDRLVTQHLAVRNDATIGGSGGSSGARYRIAVSHDGEDPT